MKRILILPCLLISACSTTKSDDHSYVNIYQHNADRSQTELAILSMQRQQQQTYKRRQVRTEEQEEYPVSNYTRPVQTQPNRVIRNEPVDFSKIDEPYIYDPKPTSNVEPQTSSGRALIMDDKMGMAYQRSTGNPYISSRMVDQKSIPNPPLYAIYGTTTKVYIPPSEMGRILNGERVEMSIP